jgi:hypothetical protein
MEVLESLQTGAAHEFKYHQTDFNLLSTVGDIAELEPIRQAIVRILPSIFNSYTSVYAAEYNLSIPILDRSINE